MARGWLQRAQQIFTGTQPHEEDEDYPEAESIEDEVDYGQELSATQAIYKSSPRTLEEAKHVADVLKQGRPVLVNLEMAADDELRRIRDFLAGVAYGVDGFIRKAASRVWLCSPAGMPIKTVQTGTPLEQNQAPTQPQAPQPVQGQGYEQEEFVWPDQ